MITSSSGTSQPTIVLMHGAFAESASWAGVLSRLLQAGHRAVAAPNPIRGVREDAAMLSALVRALEGPVVLVGHSYGGAVISNVDRDLDVRALVYVAAFAPDDGESIGELAGRYPGSTLAENVVPVPLEDGSSDLYIRQDRFHQQFCADVPEAQAKIMSITQRPLRDVALEERCGEPIWRRVPSWFLVPELDRNIPAAAHRFMAERARAREIVEIAGASHAVAVSHPDETAALIRRAVDAITAGAETHPALH